MSYVQALEKYKEKVGIKQLYGYFNDFTQEDQAKEVLMFLLMLHNDLIEPEEFALGDSKDVYEEFPDLGNKLYKFVSNTDNYAK